MAIKYSKAPISELVLGIFFKSNLLWQNNILFELILELSKEYPMVQTTLAGPNEEMQDGNIGLIQDPANAGFIAHWLSTPDFIYKISLLQNAILFSWRRRDDMPTISNYPGFAEVYEKFIGIYDKTLIIASKKNVDLVNDIRLFNLTYQDRANLNLYKDTGLTLKEILKFKGPSISFEGNDYITENYVGKYSIDLPYLNGYSIININTPTYPGIGQVIHLENKIKGHSGNMNNWFDLAHQAHLSFFENIFTETVLNDWK